MSILIPLLISRKTIADATRSSSVYSSTRTSASSTWRYSNVRIPRATRIRSKVSRAAAVPDRRQTDLYTVYIVITKAPIRAPFLIFALHTSDHAFHLVFRRLLHDWRRPVAGRQLSLSDRWAAAPRRSPILCSRDHCPHRMDHG